MEDSSKTTRTEQDGTLSREIAVALVVTLTPVLVYLRTLSYGFYHEWDDGKYVFGEHMVLSTENVLYWLKHQTYGLYSPVTMISLMTDRFFFGNNPLGYRMHNLALFAVTAALIYWLFRSLHIRRQLSAFLVCAWILNPQRVESVVWITERKDVLAGVFFFGALLLFLRCRRPVLRMSLVSACILLACGSKSVAVALPVALAAMAVWEDQSYKIGWRRAGELALYGSVTCLFIIWYRVMMASGVYAEPERLGRCLFLIPRNVLWYVMQTLVPVTCRPIYGRVQVTPFAIGRMIIVSAASIGLLFACYRARRDTVLYGCLPFLLVFLATHFQTLGLIRFNHTDFADRYNYIPSVFLLACLGLCSHGIGRGLEKASSRLTVPIRRYAAVAYLLYLGMFTLLTQNDWRDTTRLFAAATDAAAPNPRAWAGLADTAIREGNTQLLSTVAERLADYAVNVAPYLHLPDGLKLQQECLDTAIACHGIALSQQGCHAEAEPLLKNLLVRARASKSELLLSPKVMKYVLVNLSTSQLEMGDSTSATNTLGMLLGIASPGTSEYYFYKGLRAFLQEDLHSAKKLFQEALLLAPDDERIRVNLAETENRLRNVPLIKETDPRDPSSTGP